MKERKDLNIKGGQKTFQGEETAWRTKSAGLVQVGISVIRGTSGSRQEIERSVTKNNRMVQFGLWDDPKGNGTLG